MDWPSERAHTITDDLHPEEHEGEWGTHDPLRCSGCASYHIVLGHLTRSPGPKLVARLEAAAKDAAALERIRNNWPHIEIVAPRHFTDKRTVDPGSPACLRCKLEALIAAAWEAAK